MSDAMPELDDLTGVWTDGGAIDLRDDDALLSEALAPHVDADAEPSDAGCYALDIAVPDDDHEGHARRWLTAGYGTVPPFLPQIVKRRAGRVRWPE